MIYFAGRQLVINWGEVTRFEWSVNPLLLILSIVFHLVAFLVLAATWCMLMRGFGFTVPLRYGFKISYIANLGRYIPGKIWPMFGMVYLLKQIRINPEIAFASWTVATILGLPPAFFVGLIAIGFYPEMLSDVSNMNLGAGAIVGLVIVLAAAAVLVILPGKSLESFNWLLKKLKRPPVQAGLTRAIVLKAYLGYVIGWTCYGIAFYTFVNSIVPDSPIPVIAGVGSFVLAYILGWAALFSPGGLGVRELILIAVLGPFLGKPIASAVAVAARVWNLCTEILAAAVSLLIKMEYKDS